MLAQQLAEWGADNGQVQALSQMPLPPAVEHALLGWLVRLSNFSCMLAACCMVGMVDVPKHAVACCIWKPPSHGKRFVHGV